MLDNYPDLLPQRQEMIKIIKTMWEKEEADTTGICVSMRLTEEMFPSDFFLPYKYQNNHILVDRSGTGFRLCGINVDDLIVVDLDGNLIYEWSVGRKAPVNLVIPLYFYRAELMINACVHSHAPFTLPFACAGIAIPPVTLQEKLIGQVPCVNDR